MVAVPAFSVPDPGDIIIAVVGVTGSGKTSFIQHFSKEKLRVGHALESCTSVVQVHECDVLGRRVFLVDTPGFDDTYTSDTMILTQISTWLNETYKNNVRLTGIIYLHRITDNRIAGGGMRLLRIFKKLVGDSGLENIVLGTTMWDRVSAEEGESREQELTDEPDYWKTMIDLGSTVFRHDAKKASAERILQFLLDKRNRVTLQIQRDMVDNAMTLGQTAAGKEVASALGEQREMYESAIRELRVQQQEALAQRDEKMRALLAENERRLREKEDRISEMIAQMDKKHELLRAEAEETYLAQLVTVQQKLEAAEAASAEERKRKERAINNYRGQIEEIQKRLEELNEPKKHKCIVM